MEEIWKEIQNYEGLYQISNLGNVKSLERLKSNGKGMQRVYEKILIPGKDRKKYLVCNLSKNNKHKTIKIHRLVAKNFVENPNNKIQVNHIDGNKNNNAYDNLEWVTNKENREHACKLGLHFKMLVGQEKNVCKYYLKTNISILKIAKKFNTTRQVIGRILKENNIKIRRSGWKHQKGERYE
jgi:predicted nucleic acid-binding protein